MLNATLIAPTRSRSVVDFLARPTGVEVYSQVPHLEHRIAIPTEWPQEAILATDDPFGLPPLELITPHVLQFSGTRLKELVVTPRGVRLVCKLGECSRAHYAAFREIRFEQADLDPGFARDTLDAAIALFESLATSEPHSRVA